MSKYITKRPRLVEAWQFPLESNVLEIAKWPIDIRSNLFICYGDDECDMKVKSYGGVVNGRVGDYIVKDPTGDVWVVQKDIFEDIYEVIYDE